MSSDPNKISQFWQELKRRNVLRSLTIYAGSAFIILEAITIIFPRWGFPDWTIDLVLYLLILGAFINIVVAWIFDITPEGVEKTKPSSELKEGEKTVVSNAWKIATYISGVVIIGLILLNIFNLNKVKESVSQYGKSIAVLPFINDTQNEENDQFISGAMESILNNLSRIEDLRVVSRISVEQYRDKFLPIPEVAEAQMVSYVLGGSMQKYGDHTRITLKLIDLHDRLLWSEQYDREIKQAEEYFAFWSEIAQLVAEEIQIVITPEEEQLIKKTPTISLTAHSFYQKGWDLSLECYREFYNENKPIDTAKLYTAERLFRLALEYDSTFASAYAKLAMAVFHSFEKYSSDETRLNLVLNLANKALSLDTQLSEAYVVRGWYYRATRGGNDMEKALAEYNKALKFNPNDWNALLGKAQYYYYKDLPRYIEYLHQAIWRNPEEIDTERILTRLIYGYKAAGLFDKAEYYNQELVRISGDSSQYYAWLSYFELDLGNWDKFKELCEKRLELDSTNVDALGNMSVAYLLRKEYKKSLTYIEKLVEAMNAPSMWQSHFYIFYKWIAYAYWKNGDQELADYFFEQELEHWNRTIEQRRDPWSLLMRASVFALRGMKEEALADLREYKDAGGIQMDNLIHMKHFPFFDSIRDEPEFQKILHGIEAKCQKEQERVRQWLEENDML